MKKAFTLNSLSQKEHSMSRIVHGNRNQIYHKSLDIFSYLFLGKSPLVFNEIQDMLDVNLACIFS